MHRRTRLVLSLAALTLVPAQRGASVEPLSTQPAPPRAWFADWLRTVDALITTEERQVFDELSLEERSRFVAGFWQARDPVPATLRNEARERFLFNLSVAEQRYPGWDDRHRVTVLLGRPAYSVRLQKEGRTAPTSCRPFAALELFFYSSPQESDSLSILLPSTDEGFRMWNPGDGIGAVLDPRDRQKWESQPPRAIVRAAAQNGCFLGYPHVSTFLEEALSNPLEWRDLRRRSPLARPRSLEPDEYVRAASHTPPLELSRPRLAFHPSPDGRLLVEGSLSVLLERGVAQGSESPQLELDLLGEILEGDRVVDRFRRSYSRWQMELTAPTTDSPAVREPLPLELRFVRPIAPGSYQLVLSLEEAGTLIGRQVVPLEVPEVPSSSSSRSTPAESDSVVSAAVRATVRLKPPPGLLVGTTAIPVEATGMTIDRVELDMNGETVARLDSPPFDFSVALGDSPRPHRLVARALDRAGNELARDQLQLNGGRHDFELDLRVDSVLSDEKLHLMAEAIPTVPVGSDVEKLDLFLDDRLHESLYEPPWNAAIETPIERAPMFIRAVAHLEDGRTTEATRFVRPVGEVDRVEVRLVELFATVTDRQEKPVTDLVQSEVTVRENRQTEPIHRFERIEELPIWAAVLVDNSNTMTEEIRVATDTALTFFEDLLEEGDRASLITFNQTPHVVVPFTDSHRWLRAGAGSMQAFGGTAIWDSLLLTLNYFAGLSGKRALVVITDGHDQHSRFDYEQVLDYARRVGVSIYPILVGTARESKGPTRLRRLARETGGAVYTLRRAKKASEVFREIERDLRSQYLIAYHSTSEGAGYREIDVSVDRDGVRVKTIRGYLP